MCIAYYVNNPTCKVRPLPVVPLGQAPGLVFTLLPLVPAGGTELGLVVIFSGGGDERRRQEQQQQQHQSGDEHVSGDRVNKLGLECVLCTIVVGAA